MSISNPEPLRTHTRRPENKVDVIHIELAKAFDKADHRISSHKIKRGIIVKVGIWIHDFVTN